MTGFIIIDKEINIPSFKADIIVRSITGEKKTGHIGTLDPLATGVLPVALGSATKFIDLLPVYKKKYSAVFRLGDVSDTLDITGNITHITDGIPPFSDIENAVKHFTGKIEQLPPMYSAIRKNGVRLYELARKGIETEREKREVEIYASDITQKNENEYVLNVECSKGTYIRTLIDDIGSYLKCGAVMTGLRRTSSDGFSIDNSYTFDELRSKKDRGLIEECIIPVEKAFLCYNSLTVSEAQSKRFSNGGELDIERLKNITEYGIYRIYSPKNEFLGLGEYKNGDNALRIKRIFHR